MDARPRAMALGNFDGVHLGHLELLRRTVEAAKAQDLVPSVLTFDPHPVHVLAPQAGLELITSVNERLQALASAGIHDVLVQPFDAEFASLSARAFIREVLVTAACVQHVTVGYDFGFGHKRSGNVETLMRLSGNSGFSVDAVGAQTTADGLTISSTRVRSALLQGHVDEVNDCLGRRYSFAGTVIGGQQRGRHLGFPTANLAVEHPPLLADGVYAVLFDWGAGPRAAVANLGTNPTFGDPKERSIEVHALDETGLQIYDLQCTVWVVKRLRAENTFDTVEELKAQIQKDCRLAREILGTVL